MSIFARPLCLGPRTTEPPPNPGGTPTPIQQKAEVSLVPSGVPVNPRRLSQAPGWGSGGTGLDPAYPLGHRPEPLQ